MRRQLGAELLKVLTGRQLVPILAGTQSDGYPMSKPKFQKKTMSDLRNLPAWQSLMKKGLPWRHVHNTRRGPNVGYGLADWDWTPSRCRAIELMYFSYR